jgi:hypothetical protein
VLLESHLFVVCECILGLVEGFSVIVPAFYCDMAWVYFVFRPPFLFVSCFVGFVFGILGLVLPLLFLLGVSFPLLPCSSFRPFLPFANGIPPLVAAISLDCARPRST